MANWSDSFRRLLREYIESLLWALLFAFVVRIWVLMPFAITTDSMTPALQRGDFLVANRLPYGLNFIWFQLGGREPKRGEIVAFDCPGDSKQICLKRVAGLPGDRIEIQGQRLIFNGNENRPALGVPDFGPVIVPPHMFFALNDDLSITSDSRTFGTVALSSVEARAGFVWLALQWQADQFWPQVKWDRVFLWVD